MGEVITIGLDIAKAWLSGYGIDDEGTTVIRQGQTIGAVELLPSPQNQRLKNYWMGIQIFISADRCYSSYEC